MLQLIAQAAGFVAWGVVGFGTAMLMRHTQVRRKGRGNRNNDDAMTVFLSGVFWPVGIWVTLFMYATLGETRYKPEFPDLEKREASLRRRAKQLELDEIEHQLRLREIEHTRRTSRELEE